MNNLIKHLKDSFYEDEWKVDRFCATRKCDGLYLWIANGASSFNFYESDMNIPWWYRGYLWHHWQKSRANKIIDGFYQRKICE